MSRRITALAITLLLLFGLIAAQAINVQFVRAPALNASPLNPRTTNASSQFPRGDIAGGDGTILAQSVTSPGSSSYHRQYPLGSLTSGVVGFVSPTYGLWGLEAQYNQYLSPHAQPPQSFAQLLAPTSAADSITLTLQPSLQLVLRRVLAGRDGAAVAIDPRDGSVLAMYSNPNYDPRPLTSSDATVAEAAWKNYTTPDVHNFQPLGLLATQQSFPPGSTFKVVTTAAAISSRADLVIKKYPVLATTKLPNTIKTLSNFGMERCGGDVAEMLPPSCDTGYALLGLDIGADAMSSMANAFGFNQAPPLDLPGVAAGTFPDAQSFATNLPGLAYSSIGQENVRATALSNALVAAGIAHGGTIMTPHLLREVTSPEGTVVHRYQARPWLKPLSQFQAGKIVPLMQNVVRYGTAAGLFPAWANVAAKTGTSQVGNGAQNTDDWMIAFAPATHPTVAVAVVLPFQDVSGTGAAIAGPVVNCLLLGALAVQSHKPAWGTATTCR